VLDKQKAKEAFFSLKIRQAIFYLVNQPFSIYLSDVRVDPHQHKGNLLDSS